MRESVRILNQILPRLEKTKGEPIFGGKSGYSIKAPAGESLWTRRESEGRTRLLRASRPAAGNPWRYHVRAPSFINLTVLGQMCKGHKVADVVAILGSIDIVLGETDR